jgi:hypothetical protein
MNTNPYRKLDRVWFGLLLATIFTWWLGERGAAGALAAAVMMPVAGIKDFFVAFDFMALRHVWHFWQGLVIGWLVLVLGFIGLAYRISLH